jgi:hypothetical protein
MDPRPVVERVLTVVRRRAFFSLLKARGPLAWQPQLRYRNRCDLFLYCEEQIQTLLMACVGSRRPLIGAGHTLVRFRTWAEQSRFEITQMHQPPSTTTAAHGAFEHFRARQIAAESQNDRGTGAREQ